MERKKTQDPNTTTPRRRGRRKLGDLPPEEQEQVLADLESLTKPIDGPSLHLPKLRIVERYMMALLIREYEKSSGTSAVKRKRNRDDSMTEVKRAKIEPSEEQEKREVLPNELSKQSKDVGETLGVSAPLNGTVKEVVIDQPKVEAVQKVRVSEVDEKVLGKIDNVLDDLITEVREQK